MDRLTAWAPMALAVLRIVAALLFMEHGSQKLYNFPPSDYAVGFQLSMIGAAGMLEFFGGLLILLGLFTRPVAFLLSGEMAIAYWTVHAKQSLFPALNMGDAAILFCFVFLYLVFAGPGALSLDAIMRRKA